MNKSKIEERLPEPQLNQGINDDAAYVSPSIAKPLVGCCASLAETEPSESQIQVKIQNKNPKKRGIKTYEITTVQDMADCVTSKNIEGFLQDLEGCLRSHILIKVLTNAHIDDGKLQTDAKILFPSFKWIDDWKPTKNK